MIRVLVMGFGPYGSITENPTEAMVKTLGLEHADIECHVLDTSYKYATQEIPALIRRCSPDAMVLFGYAPSADVVRLECIARNRSDTSLHDIEGNAAEGLVITDGPEQYKSTLPISRIEQALSLHDIGSVRSQEAGGFVCNYSFYLLMHVAEIHGIKIAGLIHVPNLTSYQTRSGRELDLDSLALVVVDEIARSFLECPRE